MRRRIAIIALILGIMTALSGCKRLVKPNDKTVTVYASFWPIYALTDAVMQDVPDARLKLLVQPQDGCLRAYELSDWDAAILGGADAVVMGGRGLESFERTLFQLGDNGLALSATLYGLDLYSRPDTADAESESHLAGPNPHLYMSVEGARQLVDSLSATMQSLDPDYAEKYVRNAQSADDRLSRLLEDNRALLAGCAGEKIILMNEALIYAAQDYGLEVAAWIDRESGEGMSDNELAECLEKLNEAGAKVVLIEKQAPQALTAALERAGYSVARLDVFSAHREGEGFDAYIEWQSANARAILDAFARAKTTEDLN